VLEFDPRWRFQPPPDGQFHNRAIPAESLTDFKSLIWKIASQTNRWKILEHFKTMFSRATGTSDIRSSNESWAENDLSNLMSEASGNAPLFIEAFFDGCEDLRAGKLVLPDAAMINEICERHGIGYVLNPPKLLLRESLQATSIPVTENVPALAEQALEILQQSLQRSERLLSEGHYREAVQESLWVLESVATAFRGVESAGEEVRGKYFNEIVRELRRIARGSTLERVLDWVLKLHGFLSSPTGGGVRHGMDLDAGVPIGRNEARLFCNLIRSYISYLLAEHERLQGRK